MITRYPITGPDWMPPIPALIEREVRAHVAGRHRRIRSVRHRWPGTFVATVDADGGLRRVELAEPWARDDWIRLDCHVCDALPRIMRRGSGFHPKTDLLTLLACYACAARLPGDSMTGPWGEGARRVQVPDQAEVLRAAGYEPVFRDGKARFGTDDYSELADSLERLSKVSLPWRYKSWQGRAGERKEVCRSFSAPLLAWGVPLPEGMDRRTRPESCAEYEKRHAAQHRRELVLNVYDGAANTYFVLVSPAILQLRPHLTEADLRLLMWLYRQHRSSRTRRIEVVASAEVLCGNALGWRRGNRHREMVDLERVLGKLQSLRALSAVEMRGEQLKLTLCGRYFDGAPIPTSAGVKHAPFRRRRRPLSPEKTPPFAEGVAVSARGA